MKYKIIFIFIIISNNLFSQCLCGAIKFSLILPVLKFEKDSSNYSIKTVTGAYYYDEIKNWKKIEKIKFKGDTLNFDFLTGSGIPILKFIIRNDNTKEEMNITITKIYYDTPYFIDLTIFSKGYYFFDWDKIGQCLKEKPTQEIIECEEIKFYQTQLKLNIGKSVDYITPWQIKPYSLKYFETDTEYVQYAYDLDNSPHNASKKQLSKY